jgi:hypothetical protein
MWLAQLSQRVQVGCAQLDLRAVTARCPRITPTQARSTSASLLGTAAWECGSLPYAVDAQIRF